METVILRAKKFAEKKGQDAAARYIDMAAVFCNDASQRVEMSARNAISAITDGDEKRTLLVALKRFTKNSNPINTVAARQRIADVMIQANSYVY